MVLEKITFGFKNNLILRNFSYDFSKKGSIFIITGENGSGKSTLLRIMLGLIENYQGNVVNKIYEKINGSIDSFGLFSRLSGFENITYFIENKNKKSIYIDYLIKELLLNGHLEKKVNEMSEGTKTKLSILIALIDKPSIVFFDEPFNSLDEQVISSVSNLMIHLADVEKTSFVFSTHIHSKILENNLNTKIINSSQFK